jgi:hypothetical protein
MAYLVVARDSLPVFCKSAWAARTRLVFSKRWRNRTLNGQNIDLLCSCKVVLASALALERAGTALCISWYPKYQL